MRRSPHCDVLQPLVALVLFGAFITAAAVVYPGGTWQDGRQAGFSFWNNFWCDLLSSRALDGGDNSLGASFARVAFLLFAFALYRFWPVAAARAGAAAATPIIPLGRVGAACLLVVAMVPAATSQLMHGVAVVVSAGSSLVAVLLSMRGLLQRGERLAALLALLTVLVAALCLGQYVYQGCLAGDEASWLAGMQKVTTACLLALMARLLVRARS